MMCPYCGFDESNVLESRVSQEGRSTRRRRECVTCKKRFTTYERVENVELKVRKSDGRVEDYSREKLVKCIDHACWKLSSEERSKVVDEVEMKLLNWDGIEIPSREIGIIIMNKLKDTDPLAYLRFATVYKKIDTVEDFENLVKDYLQGREPVVVKSARVHKKGKN
jgi:transcriptional repressor NrdR